MQALAMITSPVDTGSLTLAQGFYNSCLVYVIERLLSSPIRKALQFGDNGSLMWDIFPLCHGLCLATSVGWGT